MADYGPSLTALRLFEKTSAKGNTYLTGRWGNLSRRSDEIAGRERQWRTDLVATAVGGAAARRKFRSRSRHSGRVQGTHDGVPPSRHRNRDQV